MLKIIKNPLFFYFNTILIKVNGCFFAYILLNSQYDNKAYCLIA